MKRVKFLFFTLLVLFAFVFVGTFVRAAEPVEVEVTAYFDAGNQPSTTVEDVNYGDTVSFSNKLPTNSGYEFVLWVLNGKIKTNEFADLNYTFTVTENIKLKGIFKPVGKHAVIFMDTNGDVLKVQHVNPGENASDAGITLPSKPGYVINAENKWDKDFTNITADTIVTLQYIRDIDDVFTLTVEGGTGNVATALFDEVVTVTANNPNTFKYWKVGNRIVSTQSSYSFTMYDDVTITAVYEGDELDDLPLVTLSDKISLHTNKNTFVGQYYLPEGYTLVEYGILTSNTEQPLTFDTFGVKKYQGGRINEETNEYVMSFPEASSVSARAYLVYKDSEGNIETVYNEFEQEEATPVFASDLFFSFYIEGNSNNKAVAIFNGTANPVDLSSYKVEVYANGAANPTSSILLTGILNPGAVFVIAHNSANAEIKGYADMTSGSLQHNGDDAIALTKNGTIIDCIGKIGQDPGDAWTGGGLTTVDMSLARKSSVLYGIDGSEDFDPSVEWIQAGAGVNATDGIKSHTIESMSITGLKVQKIAEINEYFNALNLNDYSIAKKQEIITAYETGIANINTATTAAEMNTAVSSATTTAGAVPTKTQEYNAAKSALILPPDIITEGIVITETYNDYITYQWTITPNDIILEDGSYTDPDEDTDVTFIIDILIDGVKFGDSISKTSTVKALMNNEEYYNEAVLYIETYVVTDGEEISEDVNLPTSHPDYPSITIEWESSDTDALDIDGTYGAPATDTEVTLTATVFIDGVSYGVPITINVTVKAQGAVEVLYQTGFENATKASYAAADVGIDGLLWNLDNALIGNLANDRKNGSWSVRAQASGSIYTKEGVRNITKIEAYIAKYGSDSGVTIAVQVSKDGTNWVQVLAPIAPASTSLELISIDLTTSAEFASAGLKTSDSLFIKFVISGNSKRINIDDVKFYGYA